MKHLIYENNINRFREKIHTIINKAKKFNCDVTYTEGDIIIKNVDGFPRKFLEVQVNGIVKISGDYEVVGRIKSTPDATYTVMFDGRKEANLISLKCEHCGRTLKKGLILRNINENIDFVVGTECAKNYIGFDLDYIAFLSQFATLEKELQEVHEYREPFYYDTELLTQAGIFIGLKDGNDREFSWKSCVLYKMLRDKSAHVSDKILKIYDSITAEDKAKAHEIIEKLRADDTYRVLSDTNKTPYEFADYIFSKLEEFFPLKKDTSEHFGSIGEKFETTGTLSFITTFDNEWGGGNIYEIIVDENHKLKWFTTKDIEDGEYKLKGTVKAHSEYKGQKETIVKNVKIL